MPTIYDLTERKECTNGIFEARASRESCTPGRLYLEYFVFPGVTDMLQVHTRITFFRPATAFTSFSQ